MKRIKNFIHRNPARFAAWVTSTVAIALIAADQDALIPSVTMFVLSALGLGEFAQRVENAKTEAALWTDPVGSQG